MVLSNKIAIVTGASDGLGKEVSLRLAREGVKLALLARTESKLSEVAGMCSQVGSPKAISYPVDIKDTGKLDEIVGKIVSDFGGIDILINNAGIWQKLNPLENITKVEVEDVIATNLTAQIQMDFPMII